MTLLHFIGGGLAMFLICFFVRFDLTSMRYGDAVFFSFFAGLAAACLLA